jgi:hypothetical protein
MRLSRIIGSAVAVFATVGAFALAGTPAAAQPLPQPPYPPVAPSLTVDDPTVAVGQTFTVFGSGFGGNELVRLDFAFGPLALGAQPAADTGGVGAMLPVARQAAQGEVHTNPGSGLTVRANVTGEFSVRLRFTRTGTLTITATGLTTGRTASTTVTIVQAQPPLPVTGSETGSQIAVGTMLLIAGVLLVLVAVAWRSRSRRTGRSRQLTSVG